MYFAEPVGGSSCVAVVMIWTTQALHWAWWVTLDARQLSSSGDMPRPGTDGQQTQEGETRLVCLHGAVWPPGRGLAGVRIVPLGQQWRHGGAVTSHHQRQEGT